MDTQVIHIIPRSNQERKQGYESNKLAKRLRRLTGQAIADFGMISEGDKVMVCLSGGKDSYALLDILLHLKAHAPIAFDIVAVNREHSEHMVLPSGITRLTML